jgi:2-haloacid dehalogenase
MEHSEATIDTVIFDLGGVLIDWNPYYLYRKIFNSEEQINTFLETVCTPEWNEQQDAGRLLSEGTALLVSQHPGWEMEIRAYYDRWREMLGKEHTDTVDILKQLRDSGKYQLYALTNWSAETFPVALEQFDFLNWFKGIVVSGNEKTRKPFRRIYDILQERYKIIPRNALFIDDSLRNIQGAEASGFHGIHFTDAPHLIQSLEDRGIQLRD